MCPAVTRILPSQNTFVMEQIESRCADESAKWGETVTNGQLLGGYLVLDHSSMEEAAVKEREAMLKDLKVDC